MTQSVTDQNEENKMALETIQPQHIADMANDFFSVMLGMNFDAVPREHAPEFENMLQSSIRISGGWNAEMRIRASRVLAKRIACAMFDANPDSVTEEEIHDAFCEVVNVIGGNAKGIVDKNSSLSLPCIETSCKLISKDGMKMTFACGDDLITIELDETAN